MSMPAVYALLWPGRASVPADRAWIDMARQFPRPHVTHESLEAAQKAADWFIARGAAPPVLIRQTGCRTWESLSPEFQSRKP
ncbi:hypothetical protein GALL_245200 [mine drainage metagenome]|uniref:Uncharacterized protein n=1 Tax=mine drainage metagenome TaxID=410659 RepID=A0A1J5RBU7_9ZZZZ